MSLIVNTLTVVALVACIAFAYAQTTSDPLNTGDPGQCGHCGSDQTGCALSGGNCGCCPFPNGNCCPDHTHCCPQGYSCDIPDGQCIQSKLVNNVFMPKILPLGKLSKIQQ